MNSSDYILYYTLGCHLCDDAEAVINPIAEYLHVTVSKNDIADDNSLVELYGIHIPVLFHRETREELYWPFDSEQVLYFMEQQCK